MMATHELSYLNRRQFLEHTGIGFGVLSLASLLGCKPITSMAGVSSHFPARAKQVIHIFAQGAPSHIDTWDPKPALTKLHDQSLPGLPGVALASPFEFTKRGQSGIEVSEVFLHLASMVDDMAIIRSMHTDIPAHDVATMMMNTGSTRLSKPSMGSWINYGLGSENENLPGFVVLAPGMPINGSQNWRSSFLPGSFQGTHIDTRTMMAKRPMANIQNDFMSHDAQREQLDLTQKLNTLHNLSVGTDPNLEARIESFEMAFKMQTEATDAFDITRESQTIRNLYGDTPNGRQLLIARRLLERGVRFIQIWAGGWDHHQNIRTGVRNSAGQIDMAAAAFLKDLKARGMLDSTLVIWGGEFGRTSVRDRNGNANPGRDHNHRAFSIWLAGGGVKGGTIYGATDEFGSRSVENPVHVHDLHATILRLLGFDHEKLTYRYNGRDFRLTDVYGKVISDIIA